MNWIPDFSQYTIESFVFQAVFLFFHKKRNLSKRKNEVRHASDPEIRDLMNKSVSARDAVRDLIAAALKRGGYDNVTVACYYQA